MEYIKIENGIITGHYAGDEPEEGCIPIEGEFWGAVGEPVDWYDESWNRIDDITRIESGKKEMPELGTSSDIVFMFLFFFMVTSQLRSTEV